MGSACKNRSEQGSVIVEATIVFPVMFLVIFFMIFAGNAYLQKCRIEAVINEMAIDGAAYCADPLLYDTEQNKIPSVSEYNAQPYIAIFSADMEQYEQYIENEIKKKIEEMDTGLFSGMKPKIKYGPVVKYDNSGLIYATFTVDLSCDVVIPIKLLGQKDYTLFRISNHTEMPVTDTVEFIRNIDMVEDYAESTGLKEKISDAINNVKDLFKDED